MTIKLNISKLMLVIALAVFSMANAANADAKDYRILVFGDSNSWGWQPTEKGFPAERYADEDRYAGILEKQLKGKATVIVDGLVSRATDLPAPGDVGLIQAQQFSGKTTLADSIARNAPLDLVVIMLGTNDVQAGRDPEKARTAEGVAKSAFDLVEIVYGSNQPAFSNYSAPKALIIAPPAMADTSKTGLTGLFAAGEDASKGFGRAFSAEANKRNIPFLDAGAYIRTDGVDGIHLSKVQHKILGKAVAQKVTREFDVK